MQFFYCDDTIINYEKNGLFKNIIEYLDKSFEKQKSLPTLIAYSWYLYSEGQFISQEVADDWKFYFEKWKELLIIAEKYYKNDPKISLISAYTLQISGMDLAKDLTYEDKINVFYSTCNNIDIKNESLKKLCGFLASNRTTDISDNNIQELFHNDTILDNYFKEVLS